MWKIIKLTGAFNELADDLMARVWDPAIVPRSEDRIIMNGLLNALINKHKKDAQKWIPVTERLPEESINPNTMDFEKVLCSTAFGDVRVYGYGKPTGEDAAHFWNGCGIMDAYVKAWMPLPEVYKEAGNE